MTGGRTLRIERTYHAPAQAVFDAWTSEEVIRRWWHAEHDWETTEAEVDLRAGGTVSRLHLTRHWSSLRASDPGGAKPYISWMP